MGLLDNIRKDAAKSGQSKQKIFYVPADNKKRVRFLQELSDGCEITMHDSYDLGINTPCKEQFGKSCPYCDEEGIRTRKFYGWSVWDYDSKEVKVMFYAANNCTPVFSLMSMNDNYGTMLDRDYVIQRTGKQQNTTYTVIPQDKQKFRNEKAKPISKSGFLKIVAKAFPDDKADKFSNDDKDEDLDYTEMSAKELYNLCEERGIEAEPKMKQKYYIDLLEEAENSNDDDDDWDDDESEDESQYAGKSAKELFKLCKERNIDAMTKKNEKYYINLLEEDDKLHDDWDDESDEDDVEDEDEWEDE